MEVLLAQAMLQAKRLKRLPMTLMIRNLVQWKPLDEPQDGYTVAIACMRDLATVAIANLRLCAQLDHPRLREIILVFDCPLAEIPESVKAAVTEVSPTLSIRLIGYNERQNRVARRINWGWVYSWLSWSLAISQTQTEALIIHDLDALPLAPRLFENLYENWLEEKPQFCGIRAYQGSGVDAGMGLVTTFELVLDVAYLRRTFHPFDLFNQLRLVDGRVIDFDTTLYAQWRSPRRTIRPIDESQLVHPSQLICQYTYLVSGRNDYRGREHRLPILAYFMHLGGDSSSLKSALPDFQRADSRSIRLFGRSVPIDGISPQAWAWKEKQIRRVEQHSFGETRPLVDSYLQGMIQRAGSARTVGQETGVFAVPDR